MQELEALYGDLAPQLYRYIVRLTGNEQLTQDILQETFLKAAEHLLVSPEILKPAWFYTVARNCYLAMLRGRGKQILVAQVDTRDSDPKNSPESAWEAGERRRSIREVLNMLPETYRTVLILREFENMSYQEIGMVMDLRLQQVKATLFRARRRFRQLYVRRENNEM